MPKPKITPSQLNIYTEPIVDIYAALEEQIFEMMAKRLKTIKNVTQDNVLDWQIDKLNQLRLVNTETVKRLSQATGVAEKEIRKAIHNVGIDTINSVDYELSNVYDKLSMPSHIDEMLETYVKQTFRDFDNYVNQTLITTNYGQGVVTRTYRKMVEETTAKVLAGTMTTNKAITDTVIKWSKRGIDTAFVDRGGNVWSLENYARTVIRSTVNRTYNEQRISRMDEYGVHTILVTTLPDPRDICSHAQGKVLTTNDSDPDYESIYDYGYGTASGLRGINCRHSFIPFVPGLSENNQPKYSESDMEKNREQRQRQRYLERQIRDAKRSKKLSEILGDNEAVDKYNKLVRDRQARLRGFISDTGRTREYYREKVH